MTRPTILAGTWSDGVFVLADGTRRHELAGRVVRALVTDQAGGVLAIVDAHSLCRRSGDGAWRTIARTELDLACLAVAGNAIYLGTNDARIVRVASSGELTPLDAFEATPGRDTWYAGSMLVDGRVVGPPLGVRSMAATCDGAVLLANVHVGGIPRSTDGGRTWEATIAIDSDVHEVRAHPTRPEVAIAAAAVGLCISRDGGATWEVVRQGLHAPYCSAVAVAEEDVLVAASTDHFASSGVVYRRPLDARQPLEPVALPELDGIVDTGCIATLGSAIAVADRAGNLYTSVDAGRSWERSARDLPAPSSVALLGSP